MGRITAVTTYNFHLALEGRELVDLGKRDLPDSFAAQEAAFREAYDAVCELIRFSCWDEAQRLEVRYGDGNGSVLGRVAFQEDAFTFH